jgi:3-deoxy-7-phosphoheptulonate synthase
VRAAADLLRAADLPPVFLVDCSHANSGKDAEHQPAVAREIAAQVAAGERAIGGVMIESNLLGGAQDFRTRPLVYGRSITDPCLSFDKTAPVLAELAEAVRARRGRA